jgi:putative sigma-54 modulation protein
MTKKVQFELEGYSVEIIGRNVAVTDAIRDYVMLKLSKIERFSKHILDVSVFLDVIKMEKSVSIVLHFLHYRIQAHASKDDLYEAIDKATDRICRLVAKYKDQLQEKHAKNAGSIDLQVNVLEPQRDNLEEINAEIEAENFRERREAFIVHEIAKKETLPVRMLTQDEAVMKIELSGDSFLIFKGEEDQKLKVIYKRDDEELGIIELEGI